MSIKQGDRVRTHHNYYSDQGTVVAVNTYSDGEQDVAIDFGTGRGAIWYPIEDVIRVAHDMRKDYSRTPYQAEESRRNGYLRNSSTSSLRVIRNELTRMRFDGQDVTAEIEAIDIELGDRALASLQYKCAKGYFKD